MATKYQALLFYYDLGCDANFRVPARIAYHGVAVRW
jgi:hypothetical protein